MTRTEAIDKRSKTVEEELAVLKQGTLFWKVRSFSKWYRRRYYLDSENGTLNYDPTHKSPCHSPDTKIEIEDIVDVRKGWKTDTFNKMARKVEKQRQKTSEKIVDESACFSVIYGRTKQTVDLVAPNAVLADQWVRGLNHIITVLKGLHQEQRFERYEPKGYAKHSGEMEASELHEFLLKEQKQQMTKEDCFSLIEAFEQSNIKAAWKISPMGFTNMLMSQEFEIFNSEHAVIYQDMSQPLAHYYIASSHNTYLTGGQLSGESSVEGYIDALKRGCRCVELDCWDGPEDDPIVYHGYTLTTKILFRDIIVDAIKPYAFHVSSYPVILSLENHCSEKQQEVLARHLSEVLGEQLYTDPVDENLEFLPSPETLMGKIIVKAKKMKSNLKTSVHEYESSSEEEYDGEMEKPVTTLKEKKTVSEGLSNLVNLCQGIHFQDFETSKLTGKCYEMASFSEAKSEKLIATKGVEFVEYNTRQLSRIYPSAKRTSSSNFKPIQFWNVGCQMVALNYQTGKKPVFINEAKFKQNGGCGYILKPEILRDISLNYDPNAIQDDRQVLSPLYQKTLRLEIISGQHIPKPDQEFDGDIVDPYVKVKILGHPQDNQTLKTDVVKDNGFNPRWDCEMKFSVKLPQLAMVHLIVKDDNKKVTLGTYALPFESLTQGYRHVYLMDYTRTFVSPASLFVHVSIIT
uniref:Phosphoinositide phospholipase C n=1 Tax=Timema cristinae TaxID=61476 RepID=A0A7R9GWX0_TIMCR|nr:unnamed protein product [Timema cristinae]